MFFQNSAQLRAAAKSLHKSLVAQCPELSRGDVLNALARARGYADWNALSDAVGPAGIEASLSEAERFHAHDAAEADARADETGQGGYGDEVVVQVHTGFFLKAPAYPQECDYVRVCDPLGREIAYWVADEWEQAPQEVMGAVIGALTRGQGLSSSATSGQAPLMERGPVAHIRDVDFMKTHFVVIDSQGFQVAWREEAALPFVGRPELPGYDAWQEETADGDTTALFLKYEEDGLLFESSLTVEELSALTWSSEKEAFVDPEGSVYTFYTEEKYRPLVPRSSRKLLRLPSSEGVGPHDLMFLVDEHRLEFVKKSITQFIEERREHFHKVQATRPQDPEHGDWTAQDVIDKMLSLGALSLDIEEGPAWD